MKAIVIAFLLIPCISALAQSNPIKLTLCSPDKKIVVTLTNKMEGTNSDPVSKLVYFVTCNGKEAILPSALGINRNDQNFTENLTLVSASEPREIDEQYSLKAGKKLNIRSRANEQIFTFKNNKMATIELIFRVANDGLAFRYRFPEKSTELHKVLSESTTFSIPLSGKAWIHPYDWNNRLKPSYEQYCENEIAIGSESPNSKGWAYPMLFNVNNIWIMVTEAVLDGTYCGTHIKVNPNKSYQVIFAEKEEVILPDDPEPVSELPWATPWRVVIIGETLSSVVETNMVQNLNEPCAIRDISWIKPGKSSWSWWSDGGSPRNYSDQIKFIDFSAQMGWEFTLIDAGWPEMKGGTIEDVIKYAKERGVGVWLWYHSGAGVPKETINYNNIMSDASGRKKEFDKLQKWGVKGVKVDFFDTDKQGIVKLYKEILEDAAEHHILVNFHGASLPRGMERTYPNLMTTEAIRGAEGLGHQDHCDRIANFNATIPFTRNVVGSMDYTPVTFSNKFRLGVEALRKTTMAHQLALAVVFESGVQNFADRTEAYLSLPERPLNFLKIVPTVWDETRFVAGYPGDYVVLARRSGKTWFLAGINGRADVREITFKLPFIKHISKLECITDGANPNSFGYDVISKSSINTFTIKLSENGGFVCVIDK